MFRLKSVGVMSVAKISGIFYFAISILIVPIFLLAAVAASFAPTKAEGQLPGVVLGIMAVVAPFAYGAMGFVFGALAAWIYNLVAGWIGGIEMQFEGPPQPVRPPVVPAPIAQP